MLIPKLLLIFSFLVTLTLGIFVFIKNKQRKIANLTFSILSWACSAYSLSVFFIFLSHQETWMLFWGKCSFATSSLASATFLYFSLLFPKGNPKKAKNVLYLIVSLYFGLMLLTFYGFVLKEVRPSEWGFKTNYGPAYPFFSIFIVGCIVLGLSSLVNQYIKSTGIERLQIKYCFLGIFFTSITIVLTNLILPLFGTSELSGLGPSFTIVMVIFIAYSIIKYRLMDISIVLKKGTTYFLLTLFLLVPSTVLILISQKYFFKEMNFLFSAIIFLIFFLATFVFQQIKPRTEKVVEQILFKNRFDYRETLQKFSRDMVTILNLQSLSKNVIETITQTMGVGKGSLFFLNEERGGFFLLASKKFEMPPSLPPILPKEDPLLQYLAERGTIIIREELMKEGSIPNLKQLIERISLFEAEVCIPLILKGQLIGLIHLGQKINRDIYSMEDIELLSTLGNQTAIAIENARLYEDLKKSKSYIRRADRLASLGTLTAGLAHEIRNPLVAIKTFTQLLPERLDDEEFRNHFLNIASGEVDRISSLVTELLEFARPSEPKFELEDINSILDGMILLISTETKSKHINIIKDFSPNLKPITIDREQMKQVFLNLLLNAIEATPENGEIFVRTRSFVKPDGQPYIQIEFADNGRGISEEYLEDIFTPFFTTKEKGSGLGLSISNQIIQDHKGYIDVESQLNKGTSFFVNLPYNQEPIKRRKSDIEKDQSPINRFELR